MSKITRSLIDQAQGLFPFMFIFIGNVISAYVIGSVDIKFNTVA